jgi:TolA-binding protein
MGVCYNTRGHGMGVETIGIFIPFVALSIPIVAITLSYRQKTQRNKIRELELQKDILELEIEKQNGNVKLLEEENKKLDKEISGALSKPTGF